MLALGVADKSLGDTSDIISDSSGVGTANSDTNCSISMPGTTVVCIESYTSTENGHLNIREGDIIEGELKLYQKFIVLSFDNFYFSNWCHG